MNEVPIVRFLEGLNIGTFWMVIKFIYLLGIGTYLLFSLVMIRQVTEMTKTLNGSLNLPLKAIAWIHLAVAIGAWLLVLMVL